MLNTTIGNMTRYLNLRKYAEQDPEIEFMWAPVAHYTPPDMPSRLRFLPDPLFMRARVLQQALPLLNELASLDAVMIHLFEADILCSLRATCAARRSREQHRRGADHQPGGLSALPERSDETGMAAEAASGDRHVARPPYRPVHPFSDGRPTSSSPTAVRRGSRLPDARRARPRPVELPAAPADACRRQAEDPLRRHRLRPQGRLIAA